jgi:nucleoside-diphosphate-sugar epimerase
VTDHPPNCVAYDGFGKSLAHIQRYGRTIDFKTNTFSVEFKLQVLYGSGRFQGIRYPQAYVSQKISDKSSQRRFNFIAVDSDPHSRYSITAVEDIGLVQVCNKCCQPGYGLGSPPEHRVHGISPKDQTMEKMAVTGGAGFIGSNLSEYLLDRGFAVIVIDNLSTGRKQNLAGWSEKAGDKFQFLLADINDNERMRRAFEGVSYVFHQAALPSVARSIEDPAATQFNNINGTLSVLIAARDAGVKRVVAASSSSVYGDHPNLPKKEEVIGRVLSPYALSKFVLEEYLRLFHKIWGLETVALRYFNVFGPRQNPKSEYAAVIPRFSTSLLSGKAPVIYGDGEQSRDFTFITNVLDANWRAATTPGVAGEVFNVGCGAQISLNKLIEKLNGILGSQIKPTYETARKGDVRYSVADISKAARMLGYSPAVTLETGLSRVLDWYGNHIEEAPVKS